MKAVKTGWDFFQDQILGMRWLKDLACSADLFDIVYSKLFSTGEK